MEALRDQWFAASDLAAQQKICGDMQAHFWQNPGYVPLGMYYQPTAFQKNLVDVHDGWPQFYGVRRA
jgi:peptide/nickel transport system substrate-binding protein